MKKHYHVLVGLRGCYMPNTNDVYPTRREAKAGAAFWRDTFRDEGESVISQGGGCYLVGKNESIKVTECDTDDCLRGINYHYLG